MGSVTLQVTTSRGVYGTPPAELAETPEGAVQFSPLIPGSKRLEERENGSLDTMVMLAPPGTVERRYTVALALRALAAGGSLTVLAPKDKGGSRIAKELKAFGCDVAETSRRHHRICACVRPALVSGLDNALAEGGPRLDETLDLWTWPGVFSWNRLDPGSALLEQNLPALSGRGADFGCGIGILARAILASPKVEHLAMIDIDRRAVDMAALNIDDPRVELRWADIRSGTGLKGLDFLVMNPPFHDGGAEDQSLGQAFIRRAAEALRPGGVLWLVANRHLPYEAVLTSLFKRVTPKAEANGYKIYEAAK
ncbi:class I SAM-dependent methyltransferase [Microvirga lotononidis]|uniref:class I SAM-dependent methyltransferase n=1 Tax=Microvirga lotononidis TaxID=864069 RepID=UPI002AF6AB4A|nr:class I SAM-dependent methyltransferase [Microvirga lotononidis]WQO28823.1 class I SAM-dependent methyltransferase [Microvirga lotononidis]